MASGIKIPVFHEGTEEWESYTERLEAYFRLHKTKEEAKVDTLITGMTAVQYQTLKSLVFPMKPIERKFDELAQAMEKHYVGQKNPRLERNEFKTVVRTEKESIKNFAVQICKAARYCRFSANLDDNLVDQFLAGVNLKECVKKIVENSEGLELTFQKARRFKTQVTGHCFTNI